MGRDIADIGRELCPPALLVGLLARLGLPGRVLATEYVSSRSSSDEKAGVWPDARAIADWGRILPRNTLAEDGRDPAATHRPPFRSSPVGDLLRCIALTGRAVVRTTWGRTSAGVLFLSVPIERADVGGERTSTNGAMLPDILLLR